MAGVHLLMKVRLPFTGLLSERFYTVCLSVGVSDALRMMSHSRVDPAQKRPLLPECDQAELLAPPGRVGFFSGIFLPLLFLSAAAKSDEW